MSIKKRYFPGYVVILLVAFAAVTMAQGMNEQDLIKVLQSDAAKGDKAITCKKLAIYGTGQSVPVIAPLLADKELSSWARIALEAIPGPEADAALRSALHKVEGRLLVGVINSIAVRRDAQAVDGLVQKLGDGDAAVASAAAVALGHLGGDEVAKVLTQALNDAPTGVRSAVAQGCVLCAEQFLEDKKSAKAVTLYDAVRSADVPDQRRLEAIRGAIMARWLGGVPLLKEQLHSEDAKRLSIGLRTARELGGQKVTKALAADLPNLSAQRQPLLLMAIADRKDVAVLPAVLKAVESPSKDLRVAAISALIRIGDVSCMPALLEVAVTEDALEQDALETMIRISDKAVDRDVVERLPDAKGKLLRILIELAGQRQITQALPAVVSSLNQGDAGIRKAAVNTIGITGKARQAGDLVGLLQNTKNASERGSIRTALLAICGRDGVACSEYVQPLIKSRDNGLHIIGLHALALIGGPDALGAVKSAIKNSEVPVQEEAVRVLSTWPNKWPQDSDAGQTLLKLASSAEKMSHQVLGLRGYLQYIRGNKTLNPEQKVAEVKAVLTLAKRAEEKRQAIAVLGEVSTASALDLLTTLANDSSLAEEAYSAMVAVVGRNIEGVSKDQRRQVLRTVVEKSKNNGTKQRAQRTLRQIR